MKILMLLPRLPLPLNRGDRIRSFHELTYLARRHQLWCACLIDEPPQPHHLAAVAQHCQGLASLAVARPVRAARSLIAVATGRTFTQAYFACPTLHKTVARWARTVRFDAVLAFSSAMAELAEALPARRRVLDLVDVDSQKWANYARMAGWPASALYAREARQLLQRELAWLQRFDATVVVCSREAALLSAASAATRLHVVPNGAD
ncbi:MAG: sugar transferase, partial [Phycisphaerae bacterium]